MRYKNDKAWRTHCRDCMVIGRAHMSDARAKYTTTSDGHQSQKIPINSTTKSDMHACLFPLHMFRYCSRGSRTSDAIIGPDL